MSEAGAASAEALKEGESSPGRRAIAIAQGGRWESIEKRRDEPEAPSGQQTLEGVVQAAMTRRRPVLDRPRPSSAKDMHARRASTLVIARPYKAPHPYPYTLLIRTEEISIESQLSERHARQRRLPLPSP